MSFKRVVYYTKCSALLISFFIFMFASTSNITQNKSTDASMHMPVKTVVIDPGHGGEDGGAVNDDGLLEKNLNLSISKAVADLLNFLGYDIKLTRVDDNDLSNGEATIHSRKVADMKKRLEIYNSSDDNVVISIHQNKFTDSKYSGTQIFYSPNTENSRQLAENIKLSIKSLLQPDNERETKAADKGIYLLKNAKVPAVIVECGFISNPEECKKLKDVNYQKQISHCIVLGFLEYANSV